jgi:hypothetical protein
MELHPSVLTQFCETQALLMEAFRRQHPEVTFTGTVLNLAPRGEVDVDGAIWRFQRHGPGLRFTSDAEGLVVDMHDNLPRTDVVDAWRLLQYLESQGVAELEFAAVEQALSAAAERSVIKRGDDRNYEFPTDRLRPP